MRKILKEKPRKSGHQMLRDRTVRGTNEDQKASDLIMAIQANKEMVE